MREERKEKEWSIPLQAGGFENEKNERLNDEHIPLKKEEEKTQRR